MKLIRLVIAAAVLPFVLTACQTSQSGSSSYAGNQLAGKPIQKATGNPFVDGNDAASAIVKPKTEKAVKPKSPKTTTTTKKASVKPKAKSKFAARRNRYRPIIARYAKANGVPVRLAMAVVHIESSYKANARGAAGEIGLMQLMPRTARFIGYKGKLKNLYNPETNIRYGMKYLGKAYRLGGGTSCGAILKYNAGHGAKRMNPISRRYCNRVRKIMRRG